MYVVYRGYKREEAQRLFSSATRVAALEWARDHLSDDEPVLTVRNSQGYISGEFSIEKGQQIVRIYPR